MYETKVELGGGSLASQIWQMGFISWIYVNLEVFICFLLFSIFR